MSKLGFGCASLTSLADRKAALNLLEHAFSKGITHFDNARLYGRGAAESILGDFLQGKRSQVTVTTKFGLNPAVIGLPNGVLLNFVKKTIKQLPFVQKFIRQRIIASVGHLYTVENARQSLEKSLSELKTDYIDYYLLHEATLADCNSIELIGFLEDKKKEGTIRHYGIGSEFSKFENDCSKFSEQFRVFQFDNDILSDNVQKLNNCNKKLLITHSSLKNIAACTAALQNAESRTKIKLADITGIDVFDRSNLPGFLLYASHLKNPEGITLFSSTRIENISSNVRTFERLIEQEQSASVTGGIRKIIDNAGIGR